MNMNFFIIENIEYTLRIQFNEKDYRVFCFTENAEENDQMVTKIFPLVNDGMLDLANGIIIHTDSTGGSTEDLPKDEVVQYVLDILFNKENGFIKGFLHCPIVKTD